MNDDKTPNPRYPGRGKGSGSAPISKLGKRVPISVTISPENMARLDATGRKRSAVVNEALDLYWPQVEALLDSERL